MKTELEEAAERCFEEMKILNPRGSIKEFIRMAVNFGAKWQQERMYSEEDMLNFAWFLKENLGQFSCDRTAHFEGKYIEQFKKK